MHHCKISDGEEQDSIEDEIPEKKLTNNNVQDLLKRLQSTGALIKKPKKELYCFTCKEDFDCWENLEQHLITHVSLPSVVVDKLPSDDEDIPSGDEEWSDEEEAPSPPKTPAKTPQKVDISQLLKKTGLSIKKPAEAPITSNNAALDKLSGLGFTIKKNISPVKKETEVKDEPSDSKESLQKNNDVLQKLGNLGGLKLKLRSDRNSSNSFTVVNGLKDFKTSDDEDEDMEKNASPEGDSDEEMDKLGEQEGSEPEDSDEEEEQKMDKKQNVVQTKQTTTAAQKIANALKNIQGKSVVTKIEPQKTPTKPIKPAPVAKTPSKDTPPPKQVGRPNMKQTPKRGANLPLQARELPQITEVSSPGNVSTNSTPERRTSDTESVVVKKEVDTQESNTTANSVPLFSDKIKTEASSPPPADDKITPIITSVKSEPELDASKSSQAQPLFSTQQTTPLLPVTKTEDTGVTIIEINGDSNDEDDDCCVVSATPASDIKPILPKTEPLQGSYPPPAYSSTTSSYATTLPTSRATLSSLEKQHNFNWNAPDTKPSIDVFEKSADDIFESLLSNATKKENMMSDASEYISLDTLGPQHSCDVCNTRFTDVSHLETHIRMTGHSKSIITPSSSSTLMPYNPASTSILSSLLPVKHMVEQVGKLGISNTPGFTHQQNVMINIQAYPGAGGVMQTQPAYNSYGQPILQQTMPGYGQTVSGATYVTTPGQQMPGQFAGQNFMGQQPYAQFQTPKDNYPGTVPPNSFQNPMYSTASPLQSMQQAVYGQPATSVSSPIGQMGPPPPPTGNIYSTGSSGFKSPANGSGIRIQNIQTFTPGQLGVAGQTGADGQNMMQPPAPGQMIGGQMQSPGQIRMASGANVGPRARMPGVRGQRPTLRPGIQVHGPVRGAKPGPRMPMKRPAPGPAPGVKKRSNILLPGKHDNEDCQVMALQKQREGMPMIKSVQGAGEKLNLGSQISITKKTVNKEANAMANVLASRGISVKQKQKSRSPSPERPLPHIPNLGAGMSIKHTSKSSSFSIPEAKVGGGMLQCRICKKMFMNQTSLAVHMTNAHPQSKVPMFKCEECPASYPKILQLQHHKRVFHNVVGPNRELGLPVVDMSQDENLSRLSSLGIYSFIPLAGRDQGGGCFGIPVISVHNIQNGMSSSLQALGADGLLSLGPLKPLPNT